VPTHQIEIDHISVEHSPMFAVPRRLKGRRHRGHLVVGQITRTEFIQQVANPGTDSAPHHRPVHSGLNCPSWLTVVNPRSQMVQTV